MMQQTYPIKNNSELDMYLEERGKRPNLLAQVGQLVGIVGEIYIGPYSDTFELLTGGPEGIARIEFEVFPKKVELKKIRMTKKGTDTWEAFKNKLPIWMTN